MASFFRGTLLPTPLQQAIEKATDTNQPTEDWGLIMKICDHVGIHEEGAKEAMKVIRKRLQTNPVTNGWRTIGLTLTLLEALTKNCGKVFHLQIAQKDFLKEFRGILTPKNNPPVAIQEQILGMIQTWAIAFRNDPDLINVEQFYQECKQQGLTFPPAESENTIKAAVPATGTIQRPVQYSRSVSQPTPGAMPRQDRSSSDTSQQLGQGHMVIKQMTPEQIAKLRSELDVVQTNAQVFGEMLVTLQPGEEHPQDLELLMELHKTCIQMQARIIDLLSQISIDEITVDLLRYNDEFNNSFKTFESYMRERERRVGAIQIPTSNRTESTVSSGISKPQSPAKQASTSPRHQDNEPALIKFDEESATLSAGLQNMHVHSTSPDAMSKHTPQQSTRYMSIHSASATTRPVSNSSDPERDVKEMEQWLKLQGVNDTNPTDHQTGGTANAFNDFIEKRASTIPADPISEQHIHVDLQQPTTKNETNA